MQPGSKRQSWGQRFRCAFRGIREVALLEPSCRFQWGFFALVMAMAAWLKISTIEWAVVCLCGGAVLGAEALNTAIEKLADRVTAEQEEAIRGIKDAAAGGVLLLALAAAGAGTVILLPPLLEKVAAWFS